MRTHTTLILTFALVPGALYAQSGDLSIISGALQTEDGRKVEAIVHVRRIRSAPAAPGKPAAEPTTPKQLRVSAKDPSFAFTGLEAGMYELCANPLDSGYLDPCRWEQHGVLVNVPAIRIIKGINIVLKKSSVLKVHVEDPDHLVRNSPKGSLMMGVFGPLNRFHPLVRKQDTGAAKNYEVSIPYDVDLKFHARTVGISVVDENGVSIDNGRTVDIRHGSSGSPPEAFHYRVTGKK